MDGKLNTQTRITRVREHTNGRESSEGSSDHEEAQEYSIGTLCRKSCCLGGTAFFDALKAMVTRYDIHPEILTKLLQIITLLLVFFTAN